jgi:hypothetical protein
MPCKRCRKAHMNCTISSMDRSSSKKPKEKLLAASKVDKAKTPPKKMPGRPSPSELSQQYSADISLAFQNKVMATGVGITTPSQMNLDGLPEDCFTANGSFDGYTVPVFSGLITPPSMEGEPVPMSFMPHDQGWTSPLSDSQGLDYEESRFYLLDIFHTQDADNIQGFPCLDNREQHWDQENLRRLLDMNMYLLDCQHSVSQKLLMLGNMSPTIAVHNLQTALQSVLEYSRQFLQTVKLCSQGEAADFQAATSITTNGMIMPLPTPSQSRRPSCLQIGGETGLGQPEAVVPQGSQTYTQQGRFDDVQISLILAIINCYACLVGSYHIIFSYLLQELMASSPFAPQPSPIFPSFAYATDSEPNRELHLRYIFNNSMRMLAELEATLSLPETHSVASLPGQGSSRPDGILASPSSSVLLDSLASQGFGMCVNGLATGKNSLKEIVQAINQFLDPV